MESKKKSKNQGDPYFKKCTKTLIKFEKTKMYMIDFGSHSLHVIRIFFITLVWTRKDKNQDQKNEN